MTKTKQQVNAELKLAIRENLVALEMWLLDSAHEEALEATALAKELDTPEAWLHRGRAEAFSEAARRTSLWKEEWK